MENGVKSTVGVTVDWNVVQSQVQERRAECTSVRCGLTDAWGSGGGEAVRSVPAMGHGVCVCV